MRVCFEPLELESSWENYSCSRPFLNVWDRPPHKCKPGKTSGLVRVAVNRWRTRCTSKQRVIIGQGNSKPRMAELITSNRLVSCQKVDVTSGIYQLGDNPFCQKAQNRGRAKINVTKTTNPYPVPSKVSQSPSLVIRRKMRIKPPPASRLMAVRRAMVNGRDVKSFSELKE